MSGSALRFAGYAAVFDRVDAGGDVVRPGAFSNSLAQGSTLPLLWEHKGAPIGRVEMAREDRRGLRVIAEVRDERAARLVSAGTMRGLSFGYRVRAGRSGLHPRELTDLDLVEVSLVRFPMQRLARVHAVAPG